MKATRIALVAFFLLTAITAAHSSSAAPATHTIEVRLQWDLDVPVQFTMLGSAAGQQAILTATSSSSTIPGTTMGLSGQTAWFKIAPIESGVTYALSAATLGNTCSPKARVTTEWYYDGCLTQSRTYEFSSCYQPEIGRYTPGDTCAPRLLLDTDFQFDPSLHKDDLPQFVPGSSLDGSSIAPGSMPQAVRLVAVAPTGSGNVKFEFVPGSVSKFPGIAMNYPIDNADVSEDVYFLVPKDPKKPNGELIKATSVSATLNNGVAMTFIYVNDYASWASVTATIPTGRRTPPAYVTIRVPQDSDGNLLPDAGWPAQPWRVDSGQIARGDEAKDLDGNPEGPTQIGDGLSAFEEYRGFVVNGAHLRTNPFYRDLFLDVDDDVDQTLFDQLPFQLTRIGEGESLNEDKERNTTPEFFGPKSTVLTRIRPEINPNRAAAGGTTVPGSLPNGQRGLRVIYQRDVPPTKMRQDSSGETFYYETWMTGSGGIAFPETYTNFDVLNAAENVFSVGSPNETAFVEVYPQFMVNSGIATPDFANHYNEAGQLVSDCGPESDPEKCDRFNELTSGSQVSRIIIPAKRENFYYKLNSALDLARNPDDRYSKRNITFSSVNGECYSGFHKILEPYEFAFLPSIAAVHEVMHGLSAPHSARCESLMLSRVLDGQETTVLDVTPLTCTIDTEDKGGLKTWTP
ncbi:MAG: hypothetical protein ACSLFQ_21125 [Thermoanaerobaculia bacterium]